MQTKLIKVTGMTGGGCASTAARALQSITGVNDVDVSLAGSRAIVRYDECVASPAQLKSAARGIAEFDHQAWVWGGDFVSGVLRIGLLWACFAFWWR